MTDQEFESLGRVVDAVVRAEDGLIAAERLPGLSAEMRRKIDDARYDLMDLRKAAGDAWDAERLARRGY